jgi:tetratricopeptide (TPR) repeat protein
MAYAGIADTYALFAFYSVLAPLDVVPKAKQAAEKAIALNPALVECHALLAFINTFHDWDWPAAKNQFEKALAISQHNAPTHYWYSNYLSWVEKDFTHSAAEAFKAIELEPLISHSHSTLSSVYVCTGEFEEALRSSQTAIEMDANTFLSYYGLCFALYGLGRYDEAIEAIKTAVNISGRHQYPLVQLAWLYSMNENITEAEKILDELILRSKTEFISALSIAAAAYYSKDHDKAFAFSEMAFEERASILPTIGVYPFFSFFVTDPRFQPFLKRMNFPE